MASLKVICPKCLKGQQVVVDVPPGGIDHVCLLCKTSFRVRPPARPSSDDLPAPREAVPRPEDLPAPREAVPSPLDLPAAREAIPKPGDLPAPREAVPKPGDLPIARETIPRPGDLPVDRNAVPRPGDLPVDRNAVPRPGDLPVDRNAVPRPGDLPIDRNAVPRPGDLPIDRNTMPRPGDLPVDRNAVPRPILPPFAPPTAGFGAPVPSMPPPPPLPPERPASKTPPLGMALDLSLPPIPDAPAAGGAFSLGDPFADDQSAAPPPPAPAKPAAARPPTPPPPTAPARVPPPLLPKGPPKVETKAHEPAKPAPPLVAKAAPPVATDVTLPSHRAPGSAPPPPTAPRPAAPTQKPVFAPLVPESTDGPADSESAAPSPVAAVPTRLSGGAAAPPPGENADLGFSLEFESSPRTSSGKSPVAIPFPSARVANEGMAQAAADQPAEVPLLAPPAARTASAARGGRQKAKRSGVPRWVYFAAGAVVVLGGAAAIAIPLLQSAPDPENVIKPLLPELAKDNLVAYQSAAAELNKIAAQYKESGAGLRLKAAELLLLSYAAHGGAAGDPATGDQAVAAAANNPKLAAATGRVRALVAIANGKPADADKNLSDRAAPASQLILGLARLAEEKLPAAATALRAYVGVRPNDLIGHYLLGRALGTTPEARKELELVLAKNPAHGGAQIELTRFEEVPEKRLAAAQALAARKLPGAGPSELAALHLVVGKAELALGRGHEATNSFQQAIALDKRLTAAYLALGETMLYDGKYAAALERLRAAGPLLESTPLGKFAIGGALISTGDTKKGLDLVTAAAKERPDDPRGPFWTAVATVVKQPPDFAAAEQGFRDALKKDPKFLPASLRLAAILQQQNKAQDSLAVLRAAEEAGAPPAVLQLAWGEALIVAGEPDKAQEVFEKALDSDPKSVGAYLGIASALEAQGKVEEAKVSLERTLKNFPESVGLRERLASVCLKLGQKQDALAHYQAEIQAGHATITIRLAVARLALELGKVELAQSEVKKVFDQSSRNAEAAYYLARIHEIHGSTGLALTEYRHATTWGNTPLFSLDQGRLLDKLGKESEALASLASAVSLPEGRMARGRILLRAGDLEGALNDFVAASKMTPKESEPLILQGLCYDKLGKPDQADEAFRAALKVDPDAPEPHYRLGRTEMDRAKPALAIEHFKKALAKAPEKASYVPDLAFQLAQAELLTGNRAGALAGFQKYLDLAPPDAPARPEATRQIARLGGTKVTGTEKLNNASLRKGQ